jgi:hypothetical protein
VDVISGNKLRYRWNENYPIATYLVSIAASNYGLYSLTYNHLGDVMPMSYYLFPEHNSVGSASRNGCDMNRTQVEKLSDVFGQYPFIQEKYGMAAGGDGIERVHGAPDLLEHAGHDSRGSQRPRIVPPVVGRHGDMRVMGRHLAQ